MLSNIISSAKAERIFLFSVWWTIAASILIGGMLAFPKVLEESGAIVSLTISVLLAVVGLVSSMTSLGLLIGMLVHLVKMSGFGPVAKSALSRNSTA